jgi:hypothetical protein
MDDIQLQFESGVAERFFEWLGEKGGPTYSFIRRAGEAPDLVYGCNDTELHVEITCRYSDRAQAKFLWEYARGVPDPPTAWHAVGNVHEALAEDIVKGVIAKCEKRYGVTTLLLVEVPPGHTSAEKLAELLAQKLFPSVIPFVGVYVTGRFPVKEDSSGGYRVIPIKELPANTALNPGAPVS